MNCIKDYFRKERAFDIEYYIENIVTEGFFRLEEEFVNGKISFDTFCEQFNREVKDSGWYLSEFFMTDFIEVFTEGFCELYLDRLFEEPELNNINKILALQPTITLDKINEYYNNEYKIAEDLSTYQEMYEPTSAWVDDNNCILTIDKMKVLYRYFDQYDVLPGALANAFCMLMDEDTKYEAEEIIHNYNAALDDYATEYGYRPKYVVRESKEEE